MSSNKYMVKGDEKIFIGTNIIAIDIDELHDTLDKIREDCWMEREIYDVEEKKATDLTLHDWKLIMQDVKGYENALSLFEQPFLLAFFILHGEDWGEWKVKDDYQLSL